MKLLFCGIAFVGEIDRSRQYQGKPRIPRRLRIGPPCEHHRLAGRFVRHCQRANSFGKARRGATPFPPGPRGDAPHPRADNGGWPCEYAICAFSVEDLTRANVQDQTVAGAPTGASAKRKKKVGSFPMNRFTLVFAVLSLVAAGSFAAAPRAASH